MDVQISTQTYTQTGVGEYTKDSTTFGGPTDKVKIRGGRLIPQSGKTNASITRSVETDFVINGETKRGKTSVSFNLSVANGETVTDISAMVSDLASFLTSNSADALNQILLGAE